MEIIKVCLLFMLSLLVSSVVSAKCKLMPDNIDFTSSEFIRKHDKMVEREINDYYKKEYYHYQDLYDLAKAKSKRINGLERQIDTLQDKMIRAKDISYSEILAFQTKEIEMQQQLNAFTETKQQLKQDMQSLNDPLIIDFNTRGLQVVNNNRLAGDITVEFFIRPKQGTEVVLPMGGIAFQLVDTSIVYICANFDKYDEANNYVSVRFLKSNRKYPKEFEGYLKDPYSMFSYLKGFLAKPKIRIDPSNVISRGGQSAAEPVSAILAKIDALAFLGTALQSFGKLVDGALDDFTLDWAAIGVKSITISPDEMRMQIGTKTLMGLLRNNRFHEKVSEEDYRVLLNNFTINPHQ